MRKTRILLFVVTFCIYAYFFQGWGFNQNAHFNTVVALTRWPNTFEITPFVQDQFAPTFTMDVAEKDGRVYSNKPPGLPILCLPIYLIAALNTRSEQMQLYIMTLWGSALPAALLAVGLFDYFRGRVAESDALLLASGFALGSFLLPYSGLLMVHIAVAAMLFFAWRSIEWKEPALAGALIGLAITFDLSIAPLALVFALPFAKKGDRKLLPFYAIGPTVAIALILLYQKIHFGGFFTTAHSLEKGFYVHEHLFLGHFALPDPRRVYWLTFHPLRGIFYLCPVFLIAVLGIRRPTRDAWIPLAVILYFLLFNLTFDGWTGGWGAGPRYLIPATPFLFLATANAISRFRIWCVLLIVASIVNMLAITAVRAQYPANSFGPPSNDNPIVECLNRIRRDQLARTDGSFNWGLKLGIPGKWSLVPPLAGVAILAGRIVQLRRSRSMEPA